LAMVRAFAEQIGGRFTLESTRNVGTTATLILPGSGNRTEMERNSN
jgi:signal transduction histidine kinase